MRFMGKVYIYGSCIFTALFITSVAAAVVKETIELNAQTRRALEYRRDGCYRNG